MFVGDRVRVRSNDLMRHLRLANQVGTIYDIDEEGVCRVKLDSLSFESIHHCHLDLELTLEQCRERKRYSSMQTLWVDIQHTTTSGNRPTRFDQIRPHTLFVTCPEQDVNGFTGFKGHDGLFYYIEGNGNIRATVLEGHVMCRPFATGDKLELTSNLGYLSEKEIKSFFGD